MNNDKSVQSAVPPATDNGPRPSCLCGVRGCTSLRQPGVCRGVREVAAYWGAKLDDRMMPARRDLDPLTEIPHLARNLILIDVGPAPDALTVRLQGTEIVRQLRTELTGRPVDTAAFGAAALDSIRRAVATRAPEELHGDLGWCDRAFIRFEAGFYPLSSSGNRIDMMLGAMFFAPQP